MLAAFQYMESIGGYESIQEHEKKIILLMLEGFAQRKD